jgi:hypothetical protein
MNEPIKKWATELNRTFSFFFPAANVNFITEIDILS